MVHLFLPGSHAKAESSQFDTAISLRYLWCQEPRYRQRFRQVVCWESGEAVGLSNQEKRESGGTGWVLQSAICIMTYPSSPLVIYQ